jgi:xanthine dehydrogenase molybdopterin-binding subunit B
LFLGSSVYFAIQDAIASAKRDNGIDEFEPTASPATCERIRNACGDRFVEQFKDSVTEW